MKEHVRVVAIDGPAGSGKSTVARRVAERLRFTHIDTGAMFRAVTLLALNKGVSIDDEASVSGAAADAKIELREGKVFLDGADVTVEIRSGRVTRDVPRVSSYPRVRELLLDLQRSMARNTVGDGDSSRGGIVMEGRDIGTVVFPDARWKFFIDAAPEVRAKRRLEELAAAGRRKEFEWVLADIVKRDKDDRERPVAPLKPAEDATVIDTAPLSIDEVVDQIAAAVLRC
ncbi:MAG: (d)CMP kinase [Candidatus Hydrogenedentota bacterium]